MNVLYWTRLGVKFYNRDRFAKWALAFLSSGAVASWLIVDLPIIWKCLSVFTAGVSIFLSIMNWPDLIKRISEVRSQWIDISKEADLLWLKCQENVERDYGTDIAQISSVESAVKKAEYLLPENLKLREQCYNEIRNKLKAEF